MSEPWIDDLLESVPASERAAIERAHERLVAAGPLPELPPGLAAPPAPPLAPVIPIRRRRYTAAAAAALLAVAVFGAGYLLGGARAPDQPVRSLTMTGGGASATLAVFDADAAGNWPMRLSVRGLPILPAGQRYELWLTSGGRLTESCGTFVVAGRETAVRLNAPYRLRAFSGWVVTRSSDAAVVLRTETI